ncbi:MAG: carbohydrate ABC transporter permease [Thermomicrobiales bacterium]
MTARAESLAAITTRRPRRRRPSLLPYLLALPLFLYEFAFILYPIYQGLKASFQRQTHIGQPPEWIGFDNYRRMLADEVFWDVMRHTIVYMVAVVVVALGFGLGTALLLNRRFKGRTLSRALLTLPWAFPDVPTVLVFIWMLNPNFGVMDVFARWLPWVDQNSKWLLDPNLAMVCVVLITAWKGFPFYSLVILAALQTVPGELTDAAKVDGATKVQAFFAVTLPCITPTLLLLTVLAAIFSFKQFTIIWLLTGGGPSNATDTIVIRIYQTAFKFHDFPYASTLGVAGFLLALTVAIVFLAIQRRQEIEYA